MKIQTDNWKSFRLKDIAVISTGSTPPTKNRENFGDEYGFATPGDICGTRFIKQTAIKLSNKGIIKTRLAREGSVLFVCIGSTIGKVAQIAEAMAYNQQINACTAKEGVDQSFFYYALLNCSSMVRRMAGTQAVPIVNKSTFQHIQINLPPIAEQRKIAAILSAQDRVIELKTRLLEEKKQLKKYLCHVLLSGRKRFPEYNKPWVKKRLGSILQGRSETCGDRLLSVYSVSVDCGVVDQIKHLGRSYAAKDISKYTVVEEGDVVYTKSPTGMFPFGIIKQSQMVNPGVVSPLYAVYKPSSVGAGYLLHTYFSYPINTKNYLRSLIQRGPKNTMSISNEDFIKKSMIFPVDLDEVARLADLFKQIDREIRTMSDTIEQEKLKKKALMQQLLTGKVRVSV